MTAPDPALVRALMGEWGCRLRVDRGEMVCAEHGRQWVAGQIAACALAHHTAAMLAPYVAAQRADAQREALTGVRDQIKAERDLSPWPYVNVPPAAAFGLHMAHDMVTAALAALPAEVPEEVRRDG